MRMNIGFYAPMKPPTHLTPSGDRKIARLLIRALKACGHHVELISNFRSWEGTGQKDKQLEIQTQAELELNHLLESFATTKPFDLIFTYHVYHKAPDWIGGELAQALNIPYLIAEASYAPKQQKGPWQSGHQQTLKCINQAKCIIALNPVDIECIEPLLTTRQSIEYLKPFLGESPEDLLVTRMQRKQLAEDYKLNTDKPWLISVAMMRKGDKARSYKQLAQALALLNTHPWQLIVIGEGEACNQVKEDFKAVDNRCFYLGQLTTNTVYEWLLASDVFVWPSVNEAFGLALLESQACGCPAVVQNYGGVATIVEDQQTGFVTTQGDTQEYALAIQNLITNKTRIKQMGVAARKKYLHEHSFQAAVKKIDFIIKNLT